MGVSVGVYMCVGVSCVFVQQLKESRVGVKGLSQGWEGFLKWLFTIII